MIKRQFNQRVRTFRTQFSTGQFQGLAGAPWSPAPCQVRPGSQCAGWASVTRSAYCACNLLSVTARRTGRLRPLVVLRRRTNSGMTHTLTDPRQRHTGVTHSDRGNLHRDILQSTEKPAREAARACACVLWLEKDVLLCRAEQEAPQASMAL